MNYIILLRLISGEFIIGKLREENDNEFILDDARDLLIIMSMNGVGVRLTPMNPFTIKDNNRAVVSKSSVILKINEDNIKSELLDRYLSEISGITIAKLMPKDNDIVI